MTYRISLPHTIHQRLQAHLFQNRLEQGAFLYAKDRHDSDGVHLNVVEYYLVPPEGWRVQHEYYLELTDEERARVLKRARDGGFALIDCHSHPHSTEDVEFSPSDVDGMIEFAQYVRWKLHARPYAGLVWGRESVDAVGWHSDFKDPARVAAIHILGSSLDERIPRGSFFWPRRRLVPRSSRYAR